MESRDVSLPEARAAGRPRVAPGRAVAPTPPGDPLLGHLGSMRADRLGALLRWQRDHGDVVRLRFGHLTAHAVFHPDHVRHVLQDNARNYTKQTRGFDKLRLFLGNGLLTSEGAFWLRQRRIAQPAFRRARIAALGAVMARAAQDVAARWQDLAGTGAVVDVADEMMRLTLRIAGEALLSADVGARATAVGRALDVLLAELNDRITRVLDPPLVVPTPANLRLRRAARTLDEVIEAVVRARRAGGGPRPEPDLLAMLMDARDEETGEGMTDRQLRDEVMTLFVAGHETTAVALTWTWYLLSLHPPVERRLRAELREVLGGRPPSADDVPRLAYTRMVLQESMRLYPPAWMIGRAPARDDAVAGYGLPAGSLVFLCPWVTHRHPSFWPNPEGFDPERFRPERAAERPPFAYFPFGGGPRVCIGNHFAMTEAVLILATLAQRYRLELLPGHPVEPAPLITLRPRRGMRMTLRRN